ncbi:hypothetical protein CO054_00875 [Candidatus Shapirobacteria bacterium CG_4_9_14_0_2_um_filter_39_11]|uniref:Uncharacterized protein n=1 Tax=Candidatus Shapirobacteria bacterium CG_4_9_14_0_2_um_filter_39_11 TaxID=1974478 RepID=A0A2M8ET44_9BACT|nr:MAG: hypothetical protein CO054_00875 [Candidatus Shapirobacteria bacterium CG_4_9_14_0_2_um_filter_39_11]
MNKEIKLLMDHPKEGTKTYFHSLTEGKPKDENNYLRLREDDFEKKLLDSPFPFRGHSSISSWGGVSVCMKLENRQGNFAVVARPLGHNLEDEKFIQRERLEEETREFFRVFSLPQLKVVSGSSFETPLLLKMSRWIDRYFPDFVDILRSPTLSRNVSELSGKILSYFYHTGRIIDLSGRIVGGGISGLMPFTVINSENILFEKKTDRVFLVDCGLWPKNHVFSEASNKLRMVILLRLFLNGIIFGLTSFAFYFHRARSNLESFFRSR